MQTLVFEGSNVRDIPSFYDEVNRVFMANESWQLGASLDALDDMLHGAYGAAAGKQPVLLVWHDMAKTRAALGLDATRAHYQAKLERPDVFSTERARRDLEQLEAGMGPTYFDIVLQIFADHPRFTLQNDPGDATP